MHYPKAIVRFSLTHTIKHTLIVLMSLQNNQREFYLRKSSLKMYLYWYHQNYLGSDHNTNNFDSNEAFDSDWTNVATTTQIKPTTQCAADTPFKIDKFQTYGMKKTPKPSRPDTHALWLWNSWTRFSEKRFIGIEWGRIFEPRQVKRCPFKVLQGTRKCIHCWEPSY